MLLNAMLLACFFIASVQAAPQNLPAAQTAPSAPPCLLWENCHTREFNEALKEQNCHIVLSDAQLNEQSKNMLQAMLYANSTHEHTVILNVGDNSAIVDAQGVLRLGAWHLPSAIKHLRLVNLRGNVTSIGDNFLSGCSVSNGYLLTTVDTAGLRNVTFIGNYFFLTPTA